MEAILIFLQNYWYIWAPITLLLALIKPIIRWIRNIISKKNKTAENNYPTMMYTSSSFSLSEIAVEILKAISKDEDGIAMFGENNGGTWIQASNINMIPDQNPRTVAKWVEAFQQLEFDEYIKDMSDGSVYKITNKGYEFVDKL